MVVEIVLGPELAPEHALRHVERDVAVLVPGVRDVLHVAGNAQTRSHGLAAQLALRALLIGVALDPRRVRLAAVELVADDEARAFGGVVGLLEQRAAPPLIYMYASSSRQFRIRLADQAGSQGTRVSTGILPHKGRASRRSCG